MATLGGSLLKSKWTVRKLIQNSHAHMRNRFDYMKRDKVKFVRIEEVRQRDIRTNKVRTFFRIISRSTPGYWPYFTKKDRYGRSRTRQQRWHHHYDVIIQLDKLSIDVPIKLRTGADKKWRFGKQYQAKKDRFGNITESLNVRLGLNGDFFFRLSWLYKKEGILFGRNWAKGPPSKTNPKNIIFLDKHALKALKTLMDQGILK